MKRAHRHQATAVRPTIFAARLAKAHLIRILPNMLECQLSPPTTVVNLLENSFRFTVTLLA
jgi:hypothetical protein